MISLSKFSDRIFIFALILAFSNQSSSIEQYPSAQKTTQSNTTIQIDSQFESETNIIYEAVLRDGTPGKEYGRVVFSYDKRNNSGYISRLHVAREHRQQSCGSRLLTFALDKLSSLNCTEIYWQAYPFDLKPNQTQEGMLPKLIAFYQKHGAQIVSKNATSAQMVYYPTITPQIA